MFLRFCQPLPDIAFRLPQQCQRIFRISFTYLWHIFGISQVYRGHILDALASLGSMFQSQWVSDFQAYLQAIFKHKFMHIFRLSSGITSGISSSTSSGISSAYGDLGLTWREKGPNAKKRTWSFSWDKTFSSCRSHWMYSCSWSCPRCSHEQC